MPSKRPDPARNARQRALRERRRNDAFRTVTLFLTPETHIALKALSAKWGLPMADVIARLCEDEMQYQAHKGEADETV